MHPKAKKTREEALRFLAEAKAQRATELATLCEKERKLQDDRVHPTRDEWAERYPEAARDFEALLPNSEGASETSYFPTLEWMSLFLRGRRYESVRHWFALEADLCREDRKFAAKWPGREEDYEYVDRDGVVRSVLDEIAAPMWDLPAEDGGGV